MAIIDDTTQASIETERRRRKREVALGYRIFAALRWGDLGDGHITARDPELTDHMWLLRYPVGFERATVDDLVLVGPDGTTADGSPINLTAHHIHHPIHSARPDVVAVAHTHTQWGTPFCATGRAVEPITQEACFFFDDCCLFDDEEVQIRSTDGGARIAQTLGLNSAIILRNHGLLTVGDSVAAAVSRFVFLERVAEAHLKARDAKPISAEEARLAKADLLQETHARDAFDYLVGHHVDPGPIS